MKQSGAWYFPDSEEHISAIVAGPERQFYQSRAYKTAVKYDARRTGAIDIGAHVGTWAWQMCRDYEEVTCFEPIPAHIECLRVNLAEYDNWRLEDVALGDTHAGVLMAIGKENTGNTHVANEGGFLVEQSPLDAFTFEDVSFIKMDAEGYERRIVDGAVSTLVLHRPIVCLEQKGGHVRYGYERTAAVKALTDLGMVQLDQVNDDYVMGWQ